MHHHNDPMTVAETAAALRHYGLELLKLAADIEAQARAAGTPARRAGDRPGVRVPAPMYEPTFWVIDGVEQVTGRFACCGAGTDQRTPTGDRLHFDGCPLVPLDPDANPAELLDDAVDSGRYVETAS
jgi:hypothetical protein